MLKHSFLVILSCALFSVSFNAQASATEKAPAKKHSVATNSYKQVTVSALTAACYTGIVAHQYGSATATMATSSSRATTQQSIQTTQFFTDFDNTKATDNSNASGAKIPAKFSPCNGHSSCWVSYLPKPPKNPSLGLKPIFNEQLQEIVHGQF